MLPGLLHVTLPPLFPLLSIPVPEVSNAVLTAFDAGLGALPQLLLATTVIFPFWPGVPAVTLMEVLPCPELIVHPVGTVHV
jgi:hypothetical protein